MSSRAGDGSAGMMKVPTTSTGRVLILTAVLRRNYSYFDTAKIAILTRSYFMLENVSYAPDGWF